MDTSADWIRSRTGIEQRRISHVTNVELADVAAQRALACAGLDPAELDMIAFATTTPDEVIPNTASSLQGRLKAVNAACFDLNAACTGFVYALNMVSDMLRAGSIKTALIVGSERLSSLMNWERRESAILFGDGAGAVVMRSVEEESGYFRGKLGCIVDTRELLAMPDFGLHAIAQHRPLEVTLDFHGREIFRQAVNGMADACQDILEQSGLSVEDVDLVIPHQANERIIEALVKRVGLDMERVVITVERYANTSTSSIPIALCEALEQGRVRPGMTILFAAFGAGLTWGASLLTWGPRVEPVGESKAELAPATYTGLELIQQAMEVRRGAARRWGTTGPGTESDS